MKLQFLAPACIALVACTAKSPEPAASEGSAGRNVTSRPDPAASKEIVKGPRPEAGSAARRIVVKTGAGERELWISADLVAEFEPTPAGRISLLQSDPAAAEVPQPQGGLRLWRVTAPLGTDEFSRNLSAGSARYSPVLHDGPSPQSAMLALPGGVIATFPEDWGKGRIDAWLAQRNLAIGSELIEGGNMVLIPTAPGIAAIEVCNRLVEAGELATCEPNFWREASTR